ncbi:MAG: roadblock/LC7 domain-containing protein [Candidatus Thorarchaeota archaeon]
MIVNKKLQEYLTKLKENSGITSATLITEDGLLIAADKESDNLEYTAHLSAIGAISASLISMAERATMLIRDKKLDQIIIKGGKDGEEESISLILTVIYENIILLVLLPSKLNVGLVFFEIENIIGEISDFMNTNKELKLNVKSIL